MTSTLTSILVAAVYGTFVFWETGSRGWSVAVTVIICTLYMIAKWYDKNHG